MRTVLAEIVCEKLQEFADCDWASKVRLLDMDEGGYQGLYLEVTGEEPTELGDAGEPIAWGPSSVLVKVEADELRDLCEQISRALDPQTTVTSSRLTTIALNKGESN